MSEGGELSFYHYLYGAIENAAVTGEEVSLFVDTEPGSERALQADEYNNALEHGISWEILIKFYRIIVGTLYDAYFKPKLGAIETDLTDYDQTFRDNVYKTELPVQLSSVMAIIPKVSKSYFNIANILSLMSSHPEYLRTVFEAAFSDAQIRFISESMSNGVNGVYQS